MPARIDFDAVAAAALAAAARLVPAWLPGGKVVGHEYTCGDLTGGKGDSCKVNLNTGKWADFASDERGADLISLAAAIRGIKQGAAARELAAELGITVKQPRRRAGEAPAGYPASNAGSRSEGGNADGPPETKAPKGETKGVVGETLPSAGQPLTRKSETAATAVDAAAWHDAAAWPDDGPPPPVAHRYRGRPEASWAYRDATGGVLGWVHRFRTSAGGKEILPCVWSRHAQHGVAWKWRAFDAPRPLYALEELARAPLRPVLVVEGEKCAEAAQPLLPDWAVTTWPGGCKAVDKARWALLAGRRVVIWPDADAKAGKDGRLLPEQKQPGTQAAERIAALLAEHGGDVRIVQIPPPGQRADGWDVADCVAEAGARAGEALRQWLDPTRLRLPAPRAQREGVQTPGRAAPASGEAPPPGDWRAGLTWERGGVAATLANATLILRNDSRWAGVLAYDSFNARTIKRAPPPFAHGVALGEWEGIDDSRAAEWLQVQYGGRIGSLLVAEAVEMVAREAVVHPVLEWLRGLKWDGVRRAENWLAQCAGADDNEYTRAVSQYFLRGMVNRVLHPGCKFDFCLVLEGPQGIGKSSLARALGGAWYSDGDLDLQHKDSMAALSGKWVHEFPELDSLARVEATRHKSFLSRQVDEYRPVYGRRAIKVPRQVVFVGTTNEDEYVRDTTGARRFWPVTCGAIDVDRFLALREQLFAEAFADVMAGERCYPDAEETRALFMPAQALRVVQESLVDALHDWVWHPSVDMMQKWAEQGGCFSLAQAAIDGLRITAAQLTRDFATRVGRALHQLGCEKIEKRNGMTRYWYKPPKKRPASESSRQPAQQQDGADDPLPF